MESLKEAPPPHPTPRLEAHKVTPHDLLQETPTVLEMSSTFR